MIVEIDAARFEAAHEAFKRHMESESNGVPFINFRHPFLIDDEIAYKWKVYADAKEALQRDKWYRWRNTLGKILKAVQDACRPTVSRNLLEHKYGFENSSEGALYRVSAPEQIAGLEKHLCDFFLGDTPTPDKFGTRFDSLAGYLRSNHLGCNWAFVAYLAFLLQPQSYFPIRPSQFDRLLMYYGVNQRVSGYVSWERYNILLELAEALKSRLAVYGNLDAVDIQSYMWVVGYLVKEQQATERELPSTIDFSAELEARIRRAREKERIGLLGERFVYEKERTNLEVALRLDLADRVKIVSTQNDFGYDVLSFSESGEEIHIEVKTTSRSQNSDDGFWLSGHERQIAEQDEKWVVYRVWGIDTQPTCANIGNVIREKSAEWELTASSWYIRRKS